VKTHGAQSNIAMSTHVELSIIAVRTHGAQSNIAMSTHFELSIIAMSTHGAQSNIAINTQDVSRDLACHGGYLYAVINVLIEKV